MIDHLLRRVARANYRRVLTDAVVTPLDEPSVLSGRPDAVRVLLLGSGVASGQGVKTYGLALVGALQRELQARLKRPVDVEMVRQHGAGVQHAASLAGDRLGEEWDAYVLAFGVSDALRLTAVRDWTAGLGGLIAAILAAKASPIRLPIVVAGVPPLSSFAAHSGWLMPFLARHAQRLNEATERLVATAEAASFLPLPTMDTTLERRFGSPRAYAGWAEVIADRLVPQLLRAAARIDPDAFADAGVARRVLQPGGAALRGRLQDLALEARDAVDGVWAAVQLVEGEQLWTVAASDRGAPRSSPLQTGIGRVVLEQGALTVPDLRTDDRFADSPAATHYGIRAYQAVALRDLRGLPIGVLAVVDGVLLDAEGEARLTAVAAQVELELGALLPEPSAQPEQTEGDPALAR